MAMSSSSRLARGARFLEALRRRDNPLGLYRFLRPKGMPPKSRRQAH
jgi:hypothetical protein